MPEPEKRDIDGYSFTVSKLPGRRMTRVFVRLTKAVGKGGSGLGGLLKKGAIEDQASAILSLLGAVDEDDVMFIANELLTPCTYRAPDGSGGNPSDNFDTLFQGRIDLLFKVLVFALQVNFGSFFKGLSERAAAQAAAPKAE